MPRAATIDVQKAQALALTVPPLSPGEIQVLPEVPGGLSPAAGALVVFLLLGAVASVLGPGEPPKKSKIEQDREDDSKRVVKMSAVDDEIDLNLTYDEVGKLFVKHLIAVLAHQSLGPWVSTDELSEIGREIDESVMGPAKEKLKAAIRQHILSQMKQRFTVRKNVSTRKPESAASRGLTIPEFGTPPTQDVIPPGGTENIVTPPPPGFA